MPKLATRQYASGGKMKCTCRIYGKDADEGAMTVRVKDGKHYCPRCEGELVEEGNYVIKEKQ